MRVVGQNALLKILVKLIPLFMLDIINTIVQTVGAISVLITLIYLSIQTRISNENNKLGSFQHIRDSINNFNITIGQSSDLAELIVKGQKSYYSLSEIEKLRFTHIYGGLLNIIESWLILLNETKMSRELHLAQLKNINNLIQYHFSFNGSAEFWEIHKSMYIPELNDLILKYEVQASKQS